MKYAAKDNQRQQHIHTQAFFGPTTIQPKLTIGAPHDKYEQEADQVANRVMKMDASSTNDTPVVQPKCATCEQVEMAQTRPLVQKMGGEEEMMQTKPLMRKAENGGGIATPALNSKLRASKGGGNPLPADTSRFMSQSMGNDFSNVRIHTGREAIQMNQGLNARAFTHGSDVYFNQGEYSPSSHKGKKLLAHELTHVVQQKGASGQVQRSPLSSPEGSTADLHEDLTRQYSQETGVPYRPGLQYSEGYRIWLGGQSDSQTQKDASTDRTQAAHITPDGSTASLHEGLTKQYSQETGVPYRPGLQYTEGYRNWITGQHDSQAKAEPSTDASNEQLKATQEKTKPKKDKTKVEANLDGGGKADAKGTSGTASADASLKVPLGSPWGDQWKLAFKSALFAKWSQSLTGPAKEKLDAGLKLQLDFLDLLINSPNLSLTTGLYLAGSGGYKAEAGQSKPFGSLQTGLALKFTYQQNLWEASGYLTGGFSMFDKKGEPLVPGGFVHTGASIFLRGNIGDDQHKILLGPVLQGGYKYDSSQKQNEGFLTLGLRLRL